MLPNRSLLVPPTSGFVPFANGGLAEDVQEHVARTPRQQVPELAERRPRLSDVVPEALPDAVPHAPRPGMRAATWQPPATAAVRRVEMGVLAAVCGYFTFGLGKLLGLF